VNNKTRSRKTQNSTKSLSTFSNVVTPITANRNRSASSKVDNAADFAASLSQTVDLSALENSIKQLPDMDMARVVNLHDRLEAGEYRIDYDELVQKLLDLEKQMKF
jgi:anti-sigma28 factor (negative regulator of flagellin synthesis)